jgi:hypothetical protein
MQTSAPVEYLTDLLTETVTELADSVAVAVPRFVTGLVFFTVAYVVIRLVLAVVRSILGGIYPESQHLVARLWTTVVGVFLWFGAVLVLLNILGESRHGGRLSRAGRLVCPLGDDRRRRRGRLPAA